MFRYSAFILFLFCFYSGLAAADKTDDDALLLQLDKMIEQREVYQEKVEKGVGTVLATHILREPTDGNFSVAETAEDILRWMPDHFRTEKPVIHISLNPDPKTRSRTSNFRNRRAIYGAYGLGRTALYRF